MLIAIILSLSRRSRLGAGEEEVGFGTMDPLQVALFWRMIAMTYVNVQVRDRENLATRQRLLWQHKR